MMELNELFHGLTYNHEDPMGPVHSASFKYVQLLLKTSSKINSNFSKIDTFFNFDKRTQAAACSVDHIVVIDIHISHFQDNCLHRRDDV